MNENSILRENLVALLTGEHARTSLDEVFAEFPEDRINDAFPNSSSTPWDLLEHLRLAQEDILDFIRNPQYKEKEWPREYWPPKGTRAAPSDWNASIAAFKKDFADLRQMIEDPARDLYAEVPWGQGETFLREIVTVSNHNGFHLGEFAMMRQALGTWGPSHHG